MNIPEHVVNEVLQDCVVHELVYIHDYAMYFDTLILVHFQWR